MMTRAHAALLAALLAVGLTACGADDTPAPPPHTVVSDSEDLIQIEVDADPGDAGLRAIFDHIVASDREDGGYYVYIDCATGGGTIANRLASGRFPVGRDGSIVLGLDEGETEFEVQPDRQCPAPSEPANNRPGDDEATPERQPFLDALTAIDPRLSVKPSRALGRAENTCYDIKKGEPTGDKLVERVRQRYDGGTVSVDTGMAEKILVAIESTKVCETFDLPD